MKLLKFVALISCSIALTSCSVPSVSLEQAAKECRPPGNLTWVNPIDGRLQGDTLKFEQVDLSNEQLDPNPICVLERLGADDSVIQDIKTANRSNIYGAEWDNIAVEWQRLTSGDEELYEIWITQK